MDGTKYWIIGSGGHAKAVSSWLVPKGSSFDLLTNERMVRKEDMVLIGYGDIKSRVKFYNIWKDHLPNNGLQVMRNVSIDPSAFIGANVLLNTGCQVDHDCVVRDHCIISPGAILCGGVILGERCQIGAGAIILQGVKIDDGTRIPAGSLVVQQDDIRRPVKNIQNGE